VYIQIFRIRDKYIPSGLLHTSSYSDPSTLQAIPFIQYTFLLLEL